MHVVDLCPSFTLFQQQHGLDWKTSRLYCADAILKATTFNSLREDLRKQQFRKQQVATEFPNWAVLLIEGRKHISIAFFDQGKQVKSIKEGSITNMLTING